MVEISTSVLNVKKEEAIKTFYNLEVSGINFFHIDVMDGEFVENNTSSIMLEYSEYIKQISNIPLDVHLMVKDVKEFVDSFICVNPDRITFHIEALKEKEEAINIIKYIKDNNIKVGIAIKPETKIEELYEYLPFIHMALIMTVEPGKGGQKLIESTIEKIKDLKKYIDDNDLEVDIEADGGINLDNIEKVKDAGCDIVVSGTAIINNKNYKETIAKMKKKW